MTATRVRCAGNWVINTPATPPTTIGTDRSIK